MDAHAHWEQVYRSKSERDTSWFRERLDGSLALIDAMTLDRAVPAIDVGAGRATLVDDLLSRGFSDVTALDLSESAQADAQARLGPRAGLVRWLAGDATTIALPVAHYGLWHDRAMFHFLTDDAARRLYVAQATHAIRPGGHAVVATFAPDGPEKCSGLAVRRYDAEGIASEFGAAFVLVNRARERHVTPWGGVQSFEYATLKRL